MDILLYIVFNENQHNSLNAIKSFINHNAAVFIFLLQGIENVGRLSWYDLRIRPKC